MNAVLENTQMIPVRSIEIANLCHKHSLDLINFALTHHQLAIEAARHRATELLDAQDSSQVNALISHHIASQVKDYLGFSVDAYKLGFEAHTQVSRLFRQQFAMPFPQACRHFS